MKKILISILLATFFFACNSDDENKDMHGATLVVIDGITKQPRVNELVDLSFVATDGQKYSNSRRTDENGEVFMNGSLDGTYKAAFSYFVGTNKDNFFEFSLKDGLQQTMYVNPPNPKEFKSPIVITGLMIDPAGWDPGVTGATVSWDDGVDRVHDGSYEYIQMLALEDIDFSTTPYSLVVARNGKVNAKGWAQGGKVTYKFELKEGFAKKGTFFYAGGDAKRIAGFVKSCSDFSTKIDDANWIRVINYPKVAGDGGLGTALGTGQNDDLFHNGNNPSENKNIADGVAVFKGLEVTETTVPIDAVFYGAIIDNSVYDSTNGWGYLVPDSDLYSSVNTETGEVQPYFGQGTNQFLCKDVTSDYNSTEFLMLGGVFGGGNVYSARGTTYKKLAPCPGDAVLADIESGEGISTILEAEN